jgi:hypothetical protein
MAAIDIPAVGESFLGEVPQVVKVRKVTAGFTGSGADVIVTTQGTYALANVPAGAIVLDVKSNVDTAFTALATLTIGDGTDPDGFLASAKIAPQSAVSSGVLKSTLSGTQEAFAGGRKYAAADTIDLVLGGADLDAGLLSVWISYIEDETQL